MVAQAALWVMLAAVSVWTFLRWTRGLPVLPRFLPSPIRAPPVESFPWRGARIWRFSRRSPPEGAEEADAPALTRSRINTYLVADIPVSVPGRVMVLRDIARPDFQARNLADVFLGDRAFDEMFLVEESRLGLAAELLTPDVRARLVGLRRAMVLFGSTATAGIALTLFRNRAMLAIPKTRDPEQLDWALGLMRAVVEAVVDLGGHVVQAPAEAPAAAGLPEPAGPRVVAVALPVRGGECLVCGCPIDAAPAVRCRECKTPHHAECFRYVGRCGVYACGCQEAQAVEERAGPEDGRVRT